MFLGEKRRVIDVLHFSRRGKGWYILYDGMYRNLMEYFTALLIVNLIGELYHWESKLMQYL